MRFRTAWTVALICVAVDCKAGDFGWSGSDLRGVPCHGISAGYGPYDYNDPVFRENTAQNPLRVVESYHYTKHVQLLLPGVNPEAHSSNAANLDYVLRAFPNHHRALWTMIQWYMQNGRPPAADSPVPPAECWLQRAIAFRPKDSAVYTLYGIYLHLAGLPAKSIHYYKQALALDANSAEAHYNYGLVLVDLHRYQEATEQAQRAYELGYPLPGLRQRLQQAGYSVVLTTPVTDDSSRPVPEK